MTCSRSPSYRRTVVTPGGDDTLGPAELVVLRSGIPSLASTAQSDRVLLCTFTCCAPPPSSQLACAVCAGTFSSSCEATNLLFCPSAPYLQRLRSSRHAIPPQHLFPLTRQVICASITSSIVRQTVVVTDLRVVHHQGKLPRVWRSSLAPKPNVAPPPNGAAPPSTLGRERDGDNESPNKRLHNHKQNRLNAPGYTARAWAHYKQQLEGPHSHE